MARKVTLSEIRWWQTRLGRMKLAKTIRRSAARPRFRKCRSSRFADVLQRRLPQRIVFYGFGQPTITCAKRLLYLMPGGSLSGHDDLYLSIRTVMDRIYGRSPQPTLSRNACEDKEKFRVTLAAISSGPQISGSGAAVVAGW
jgi:hypothetical protein